jgi:lysozyme
MLQGIDISAAQGHIDWAAVAAAGTVNYAFCKATEGVTFTDKMFKINWDAIKAHGLVRGAYHFARPDGAANDAIAEADFFVSTVGTLDLTDMLVLDIEVSKLNGTQFTDWALTWMERVEKQSGCKPICYTGGPFFISHHGTPSADTITRMSRFPLWLAAYTNHPEKYVPVEWKSEGWKLWQRSGDTAAPGDTTLHVPGIGGNVDRDEFVGTLDELKAFATSLHLHNSFTDAVNTIVDLGKNT